jgi:Zn2+/Cd2+-exporting ATPase
MLQRTQFRVSELDCAEEILQLRRGLEGRPGIEQLDFDVLNARMSVTFDTERTTPTEIIERVAGIGMHAQVWDRTAKPEPAQRFAQRHSRSIATFVSGGLLLLAFILHAVSYGGLAAALGHGHGPTHVPTVPAVIKFLYSLSIASGFWFIAPRVWSSLRRARPDIFLLMSVAVAGALILQQWFEAATVTFLFSLSLLLEHWSVGRARRAIESLLNLSPATARCKTGCCNGFHERPVEDVALGTTVAVHPGERIPLDGVVSQGMSSVNEAPITGESLPVAKRPGDEVYAGTINDDGVLEFQVTRAADDTTLARIVHMVEEAQSRRAPSEQWVETFARYYTPAMMGLAVAVAVVPPLVFGLAWTPWFYSALVLLVIACPCALVISTPVSIVSGLTSAARNGVLIKGGRYLEAAAHIQAVALDKTGTLTHGQPVVQSVVPFNGHTREEVLARAAAMEWHSRHPLARAILQHADEAGITPAPVDSYRVLSGKGAEGLFSGRPFWIGSQRLLQEKLAGPDEVQAVATALADAGHSVVAIGNSDHVCGLLSISDRVRDGIGATIDELRRAGVQRIVMLTGDNHKTAADVARVTGVDEHFAELMPEDKVREIEALRAQYTSVAMVGDGVNDAPAMAASNLGIAMGAMGTDTAIETADIALMSDDLSKLPWLIGHARRTLNIIRQNIAFALGIKLLFVLLTLAGTASLWMAIAADTGAALLVIFNSLRLLKH